MQNLLRDKILIVGSTGLVGSNLLNLFNKNNLIEIFRNKKPWMNSKNFYNIDIFSNPLEVMSFISEINSVIFLAFPVNLDAIENMSNDEIKKFKINFEKFINILNQHSIPILFLSTDAVLWGIEPSTRNDQVEPLNPVNIYSYLKIECEKILKNLASKNYVIIRATPVGFHAEEKYNGFLGQLLYHAEKQKIYGFVDNMITPVSINRLNQWIYDWAVCRDKEIYYKKNVYHISSYDSCSKYELIFQIFKKYNLHENIIKHKMNLNTKAKRVLNQSIICSKEIKFSCEDIISEINY
ncbi:sugar nucleotide-binding protein [Fluviispira vulneris]|uniref:sugar nucleotide-binding protein n=1 Tax=Fluviispira vulneris TaxID=2763012 RepID=UPI00164448F6|nr:sugar nucleotide-binding protein [Fluviispira vulneris]